MNLWFEPAVTGLRGWDHGSTSCFSQRGPGWAQRSQQHRGHFIQSRDNKQRAKKKTERCNWATNFWWTRCGTDSIRYDGFPAQYQPRWTSCEARRGRGAEKKHHRRSRSLAFPSLCSVTSGSLGLQRVTRLAWFWQNNHALFDPQRSVYKHARAESPKTRTVTEARRLSHSRRCNWNR